MRSNTVAVALVAAMSIVAAARAGNWPAFRGADGQSVSADKGLPVEWAPDRNVRWRVALPGRGNGSPVVWGERVFVGQFDPSGNRRTVMCFGRGDGKLLWESGVSYAEKESHHPDNPYCSGTPATDGQRVVVSFGSAGVYCYDFDGNQLWHRDLGKLEHMFGNAVSPVIAGDLVYVSHGPGTGSKLVALDKHHDKVVWEAQPPKVDPGEQRISGPQLAGPAVMLSMQLVESGDKDDDEALSREEMVALADAWFDKIDPQKAGTVTKDQLFERLGAVGQAPPGAPADYQAGKVLGPGLLKATDVNRDGSLSREELRTTFAQWFDKWGGGAGEPIDANQVMDGLGTIYPPLPGASFGGESGPGGSWSTPVLIRTPQREELIVAFPNRLCGYDPKTGKLLWFSRDLKDAVQTTPVFAEGVIIAQSGDMAGGSTVAVRPGGSGDVTESRRAWKQPRVKGSIGSGVAHGGHYYAIATEGFVLCTDLKTGKQLWQKRLEGTGDKNSSWSSMLLAEGRIYVPNQSGDVFVLRAAPKFEVLATNSVNEPTNASLAASNGQLFLRTDKSLWCIGGK